MSRYGLFGSLRAHPGKRDELLALLLDGADRVAAIPGCEVWVVSTSPDDADAIWIMEVWASEADHAASLTDEGVRATIERARPLIASMGDRVVLEPLAGKPLSGTS
jgi:quinol monooxygenase YgiN